MLYCYNGGSLRAGTRRIKTLELSPASAVREDCSSQQRWSEAGVMQACGKLPSHLGDGVSEGDGMSSGKHPKGKVRLL